MLLIQDLPNSLGDPALQCRIFIYVAAPSLACLSLSFSLRLTPCLPSSFILHALFFYYSFTAALSPTFW